VNYVLWVRKQNLFCLKFLDESHVDIRGIRRVQGIGPRGQRVVAPTSKDHKERFSVTLLTSLSDDPIYLEIRENTNTQLDFLHFLCLCIAEGKLGQGDFLICDNASIHAAQGIENELQELQQLGGFKIIYLPTYSPEVRIVVRNFSLTIKKLNPCELVFNSVKHFLRYHINDDYDLRLNILLAFSSISSDNMLGFYKHALQRCDALNLRLLQKYAGNDMTN